ncbi:MAG: Sec-independent protein translocase protein TatB [Kangiellaceae bacterium]|nr:Sec-independent protein translocase protein TatB [Kangiellaceae bacterium]MCW8998629.1 Sec-independent protein translocase protein TatB [Kangiellaceae bacterium]MCW9017655.1 Sec-independent protein translocase protein TatB [Kangiellaceae bacterium]
MSFWEVFVVGVIALIVLGPERLPKAARTVGLWVGKAKQGFNSIKTEIDRELKVKELQEQIAAQKQNLENQMGLESLNQAQQDMNQLMDDANQSLTTSNSATDKNTNKSASTSNDKPAE